MDFAGKDFIYLSKIKKDKVRKIRKSEEDNKGDAPLPNPIIASSSIESKLSKYSQNFNKPRKGSPFQMIQMMDLLKLIQIILLLI